MTDDIVPEILKNILDRLAAIEVRLGNLETALADLHGQFSFITSSQPSVEALARLVADRNRGRGFQIDTEPAIKSGRVSAIRNDQGGFLIDPSELFRVYPRNDATRVSNGSMAHHATGSDAPVATDDGAALKA